MQVEVHLAKEGKCLVQRIPLNQAMLSGNRLMKDNNNNLIVP